MPAEPIVSSINLLLASPHLGYHPPPDLSRPALRAAFELGCSDRVVGMQSQNTVLTEQLAAGGLEALRAYTAGRQADARAPAPLAFELVFAAATGLFGVTFDVRTDVRRQLPWLIATMVGMWSLQTVRSRLEARRARALGLTPETAPLPGFAQSEAVQIAIAVGYQSVDADPAR